jgi:hypothetical protein
LGTAGTIRNWIKDFAHIAQPLTNLTHTNTPFVWDSAVQETIDSLKNTIIVSPAIHPINYSSQDEVILAVDSSYIACGSYCRSLMPNNILLTLDQLPGMSGNLAIPRQRLSCTAYSELYALPRSGLLDLSPSQLKWMLNISRVC